MTKKSTIGAAAAVAALALAAVASGANAAVRADNSSIAQSNVVFGTVALETLFDLETIDSNSYSLDSHTVLGCVGASSTAPIEFGTYGPVSIPGTGVFRTADPFFTGLADEIWSTLALLDSSDYDLRLVDDFGFGEVIAHATNGNPNQDCVNGLPPL